MNRAASVFMALAGCALIAGCGKSKPSADATQAAAGGKVLPGTISDAMIDLDTSTATPPLSPRQPQGSETATAEEKKVGAEVVEEVDAPTPAASASPSASASDAQPSGD